MVAFATKVAISPSTRPSDRSGRHYAYLANPHIGAASSGLFNEFVCTRRRDLLAPNPAIDQAVRAGSSKASRLSIFVGVLSRLRREGRRSTADVDLSHAPTYGEFMPHCARAPPRDSIGALRGDRTCRNRAQREPDVVNSLPAAWPVFQTLRRRPASSRPSSKSNPQVSRRRHRHPIPRDRRPFDRA